MVQWQGELLLSDLTSVRYSLKYDGRTAKLLSVFTAANELISAVATDSSTKKTVCLVQGASRIYLKIMANNSLGASVLNLPDHFDIRRYPHKWLFAFKNRIYVIVADKYAVFDKNKWNTQTFARDSHLPNWAIGTDPIDMYFSPAGIYCPFYKGEWGNGILYFDFKTKRWKTVTDLASGETDFFMHTDSTGIFWLLGNDGIQKFADGLPISRIKFRTPISAWLGSAGTYMDSSDHLYFSTCGGQIFRIVGENILFLTKISAKEKERRQDSKLSIRKLFYVAPDIVIVSSDTQDILLFDRNTSKFIEARVGTHTVEI